MVHTNNHVVIKLPQELGRRLKVEAALRGTSMVELASMWIEAALSLCPADPQAYTVVERLEGGLHRVDRDAVLEALRKLPRRTREP